MEDKEEGEEADIEAGAAAQSASARRKSVLMTEKDLVHMGAASSLMPVEGKRVRRSAEAGKVKFRRAGGWHAMDEEPEEEKKSAKKRQSGKRPPKTAASSEKSSSGTASSAMSGSSAALGGDEMSDAGGKKRPRELFPDGEDPADPRAAHPAGSAPASSSGTSSLQPALASGGAAKKKRVTMGPPLEDIDEEGEGEAGEADADGAEPRDEAGAVKEEGGSAPRKKRNRTKKLDEGDTKELKPRHLKGKRKEEYVARQVANRQAALALRARAASGVEETTDATDTLRTQLTRMLRPKLRRWAMYEWFYSPIDYGWYRENEFMRMLQDAGLGHVTHLTRREWSFLRNLFGRPSRFSVRVSSQPRRRDSPDCRTTHVCTPTCVCVHAYMHACRCASSRPRRPPWPTTVPTCASSAVCRRQVAPRRQLSSHDWGCTARCRWRWASA